MALPPPGSEHDWHVSAQLLLRAAGRVPKAAMREFVRALWNPSLVGEMNIFLGLSLVDRERLRDGTLAWLQLVVLEDKLQRIVRIAQAAEDAEAGDNAAGCDDAMADALKELCVTRTWDAAANPEWLAFEADSQLQIRPAQYALVRAVLQEPGAIVQLNMGEGKTRVIVPMLILHWTRRDLDGQPGELVRLHLLQHLIPEAFDFLHEHLTGSVLQTKLFRLSFQRDVPLTPARAALLPALAAYCRREAGAVLMSPESRCSLHLKQHELQLADRKAERAQLASFEALPWRDIYDESDAVLRVKYQLVYAVGTAMPLPSLEMRAVALHAVLRALHDDPATRALLSDARIAVSVRAPVTGSCFAGLRLLPGKHLDAAMPALMRAIATAVLASPPYELRWLPGFAASHNRDSVMEFVTNAQLAADEIIPPTAFGAIESHREALLALRGLLAHGVLAHCMRLRHRVDYGVPPEPGRKQLAVPFRACDVASERAEFAHPDCALALTTLSYYYAGLTDAQVHQAFSVLQSLGPTAQEECYREWFVGVHAGLSPADAASIDTIKKVDTSNTLQFALLCRTFRHSMDAINFWLRNTIFPTQTQQYPKRIKATAWHMRGPDAGIAIGFSGTNDHHRLLPAHVHQLPPPDDSLQATNGRMLSMLLEHAEYDPLPAPGDACAWETLLRFAVGCGSSALIDAGALLAGVSNADAATFVLGLLQARDAPQPLGSAAPLRGVVYFEASSGHGGEWMAVAAHDGSRWPLKSSPLRERDCFVLFDERNCRGADMRLRRRAHAVVTLAPRMCKDTLMQAAGRMRQLGLGQTLRLTAQRDVHAAVLAACGAAPDDDVTVQAALRWVVGNTIDASRSGLLEWAMNGLHYAGSCDMQASSDRILLDEKLELGRLYAPAAEAESVANAVTQNVKQHYGSKWRSCASSDAASLVKSVATCVSRYGSNTYIAASVLDEECERVLEQEAEKEKEVETEAPVCEPRAEEDWDVCNLAGSPLVAPSPRFIPLADAVRRFMRPAELCTIAWAPADAGAIFVTSNFVKTLKVVGDGDTDLSLYQRRVDAFVSFADGAVLLLSDREADALLQAAWCSLPRRSATAPPLLMHLCYARSEPPPQWLTVQAFPGGATLNMKGAHQMSPDVLARLQLFNGEAMFGSAERVAAVAALLPSAASRDAALLLPSLRQLGHLVARSQLEGVCQA